MYVGSNNGNIYCLDALNGDFLWNYTTAAYGVWSSPAIFDGKVYIGGGDDYNVYCLNASDGGLIWNFPADGSVISSPAVADGKVYVGSEDNTLYCLNASTGDSLWSFTTGGSVQSSPCIVQGRVYVGSADGQVYCLTPLSAPIPTLSEWGMLILGLLLLAAGTVAIIRRKQKAISKAC